MSFIADKQTLGDLNLLGKYKPDSMFSLFNQVRTGGGERLLQEMFQHPLQQAGQINERSSLFRYFEDKNIDFPLNNETFSRVENYLSMGSAGNYPAAVMGMVYRKFLGTFLHDEQFAVIRSGLVDTIRMLNIFRDFLENIKGGPYEKERLVLLETFKDPRLNWLREYQHTIQLPLLKVAEYDLLLKHTLRDKLESILESIYRLDVYTAVSKVSRVRGFSYAHALVKEKHLISAAAVWHPGLIKGIANPVSLDQEKNMFFLTGANMAGKSTFMKSFGIAVYMAHMGFPVAAKEMLFSIRDGLYSSINVPDDLNMGYSHFYAEVLRVKKVAEEVSAGRNLVVLCDELFKGTNVKDAYDATLSVTEAFSAYRDCFFMISTHIIEVGESLRKSTANLQFFYLPTSIENNIPKYTYLLEKGITSDRQGMMIIENEGILALLNN